jgi:hypothetical protein
LTALIYSLRPKRSDAKVRAKLTRGIMKSSQITRGLFRLWVVASVIWLVFAIIVTTWPMWPDDNNVWTIDGTGEKIRLVPNGDGTYREPGVKPSDLPTAPWLRAKRAGFDDLIPDGHTWRHRTPIAGHLFEDLIPRPDSKSRDATVTASIIAGPPLIVLSLGLSMIWVIRGFRNTEGAR